MLYQEAWPLIEAGKFPPWPRFQRASIPKLSLAELWEGMEATGEAIAHIAREQAIITGGHAGAASSDARAALAAANDRLWKKLTQEYEAYKAEIDRRPLLASR